ncbi:MAG: dethiobiotin synthase [Cyclobacteriaceae bacterium]|nr:dethiobiotin synthase [Cyclobacteriaceae bacterium]
MNYFVTAIGTDSGKTLVSALLVEFLKADYWKPIQAGLPRDTDTVMGLVSNTQTTFHPEQFLLQLPASPHASARHEGLEISLSDFQLPAASGDLVIEGAGGILVPINDRDYVIDLAGKFSSQIILVSNLYLGSINHTLLSIDYLQRNHLPIKGIIFNGPSNPESEQIILKKSGLTCLLKIEQEKSITKQVISKYVDQLKQTWHDTP